jgi:hypothetical protein
MQINKILCWFINFHWQKLYFIALKKILIVLIEYHKIYFDFIKILIEFHARKEKTHKEKAEQMHVLKNLQ